jgi:Rad3-related DNA helicase
MMINNATTGDDFVNLLAEQPAETDDTESKAQKDLQQEHLSLEHLPDLVDNRDTSEGLTPQDFGMPTKFRTFRQEQLATIFKISSSEMFITELDAPTGVGKSLTAACAQAMSGLPAVISMQTKSLQDQYAADFPDAAILKGRVNYPCNLVKDNFPEVTAADCIHNTDTPCKHKMIHSCLYETAKANALAAPLTIVNQAYLLTELNHVGRFERAKTFHILDECDTIEDALMSFIEFRITQRMIDSMNLGEPQYKTKFESWIEWAVPVLIKLQEEYAKTDVEVQRGSRWRTIDYKALKYRNRLKDMVSKLSFFVNNVDDSWVWYPEQTQWTFKPVWVSKYAENVLWKYFPKNLGMSATILDPKQFNRNVGLTEKTYDYIKLPCPFAPENRKIIYKPVTEVTYENKAESYPLLARDIEKILAGFPHKVLIQTTNNELAKYLIENVKSGTHGNIGHNTANRSTVMEKFKHSKDNLALFSPSFVRGTDLPDDACRGIIFAKLPFPSLADPQVKKRLYGSRDGQRWYAYKTAQALQQGTGRATRNMQDWSVSWILDAQFGKFAMNNRGLLADWWLEALVEA